MPTLAEPLHAIPHPLIRKAQTLPSELMAGGAERILSINDRVWYKVKIGRDRGAAILLSTTLLPDPTNTYRWWLCAAGNREDGSRGDFYAALEREARRVGDSRMPTSDHLLPTEWDWKRLAAELAIAWQATVSQAVVGVIASSLDDGERHSVEFGHYVLSAVVHPKDGDAYLSLRARGFVDSKIIAVILASVPGVPSTYWQVEPSDVAGMPRDRGELIWSTLLPETAIEQIRLAARGL